LISKKLQFLAIADFEIEHREDQNYESLQLAKEKLISLASSLQITGLDLGV